MTRTPRPGRRGAARRHDVCRRAGSRPRDQRGAVALVVAAFLAVAVAMAAFVVDLGMQRALRTDLQSLADVVALDLVRDLDGRPAQQVGPKVATGLTASLARNRSVLGEQAPAVTFELGRMTLTGQFETVPATTAPTAVRVTATSSIGYRFAPGRGGASRSAVASSSPSACYNVGTYAAMVQAGRSALLNPLLRRIGQSDATLSVVDYTALASGPIDLGRVAVQLGFGTVNELARATVRARDFYAAVLTVLPAGASPTTVQVLQRLQVWASPTLTFSMGKVLGISSGAGSVGSVGFNVIDLVAGSMFAINGSSFIDAYVGTLLPGITNTGIRVKLLQGPRKFCGSPGTQQTTAGTTDTEQLGATVNASLSPSVATVTVPPITGLLGVSSPLTVHQPNNVNTTVSAAGTQTTLRNVFCTPGGVSIDVVNGLATITLETNVRTTLVAELNVGLLGALTKVQVDVNAGIKVTATLSRTTVDGFAISVPPRAYDTFYATSAAGLSVGIPTKTYANVSAHASLLGGALGGGITLNTLQQTQLIDAAVNGAVSAYFDTNVPTSIVSTLVNPILSLAGIDVGGSRISLDSSPSPDCGRPALVG